MAEDYEIDVHDCEYLISMGKKYHESNVALISKKEE